MVRTNYRFRGEREDLRPIAKKAERSTEFVYGCMGRRRRRRPSRGEAGEGEGAGAGSRFSGGSTTSLASDSESTTPALGSFGLSTGAAAGWPTTMDFLECWVKVCGEANANRNIVRMNVRNRLNWMVFILRNPRNLNCRRTTIYSS